ncbi:MAG: hypothetical protein RLZZ607_1112, partial [Pseudomonadota bacterium]
AVRALILITIVVIDALATRLRRAELDNARILE